VNVANPWSVLPSVWMSVGLLGFKWESTYQGYNLDEMPPIPIQLDDDLAWLCAHGKSDLENSLAQPDACVRPLPPATVVDLAVQLNLTLPPAFIRFMTSSDLQSRVKSCTACYLDPGQRIVETIGSIRGHLIHFLSDSQSCAHWYLHVLHDGQVAVLESDDLYCYLAENAEWIENPACRLDQIDLTRQDFRFCAFSFSEFVFRFWIENEIWYAIHGKKRPLTSLETAYLAGRS
jgi:hypothetical protein